MRAVALTLVLLAVPLSGCLIGADGGTPRSARAMLEEANLRGAPESIPLHAVFAIERHDPARAGYTGPLAAAERYRGAYPDDDIGDGLAYAWTFLRLGPDGYDVRTLSDHGSSISSGRGPGLTPSAPAAEASGGLPLAEPWLDSDEALARAKAADPDFAAMLTAPGDLVMLLQRLPFPGPPADPAVWAFAHHPYESETVYVAVIDAKSGQPVPWGDLYLGNFYQNFSHESPVGLGGTRVELDVYPNAARAKLVVTADEDPPLADVRMTLYDPNGETVDIHSDWPAEFRLEIPHPAEGGWRLDLENRGLPVPSAPRVTVQWCVDGRHPDPLDLSGDLDPNCDRL